MSSRHPLEQLLKPSSIAIIGASEEQTRFGGRTLPNLLRHQFRGRLVAVNPHHSAVRGVACYPSIVDVPDRVDLAIVAVPAQSVLPTLRACAQKGVRLANVITAGFSEMGESGAALQREMTKLAQESSMRILGPNCLGFLNVPDGIAAAAAGVLSIQDIRQGAVSLVSQSGALAFSSIFIRGHDRGVGFRYVVSSGNECDLTSTDFISFFVDDEGTHAIAALVEGFRDPAALKAAFERAADIGKPVVLLKVGQSEAGRRSAAAHTASLAGLDDVHDAFLRQLGVMRVDDIDQLWEVPWLLSAVSLPKGRNVGIISGSGGLNGILSDRLQAKNLRVPALGDASLRALRSLLPEYAFVGNPLDVSGSVGIAGNREDIERFCESIRILDRDPAVDVIVLGLVIAAADFAAAIIPIAVALRQCQKPAVLLAPGGSISDEGLEPTLGMGLPVFRSTGNCAAALGHLCDYGEFRSRWSGPPKGSGRTRGARTDQGAQRLPTEPLALLEHFGIQSARQILVSDLESALQAAADIGYPVALKTAAPSVVHKTELGAVAINIQSSEQLASAFRRIFATDDLLPAVVQEMVSGVEMLLGVVHDPEFGPVLALAAGGTLVELLEDKTLAIAPIGEAGARAMVESLRSSPLLRGFRGRPDADEEALVQALLALSRIAVEAGDRLVALDINPLMVRENGRGARAVDATIEWRVGPD